MATSFTIPTKDRAQIGISSHTVNSTIHIPSIGTYDDHAKLFANLKDGKLVGKLDAFIHGEIVKIISTIPRQTTMDYMLDYVDPAVRITTPFATSGNRGIGFILTAETMDDIFIANACLDPANHTIVISIDNTQQLSVHKFSKSQLCLLWIYILTNGTLHTKRLKYNNSQYKKLNDNDTLTTVCTVLAARNANCVQTNSKYVLLEKIFNQ